MAAFQSSVKYLDRSSVSLGRELLVYVAAVLSLTAALIHLWAMPEHMSEWWGYGTFFLGVATAQGLYGVALLRWPGRRLFLLGVVSNLAIVAFYIITRTAGIPFFGPHAGEVHAAGALDLACTAAELALVIVLVARVREWGAATIYLVLGALQTFGTGLILHPLHSGMHEAHGLSPTLHYLSTSLLAVPLSVLALLISTPFSRGIARSVYGEEASGYASRLVWALTGAVAYAGASIPANGLAARHAEAGSFAVQALRDASVVLGATFLLLFAVAALRGAPWETPRAMYLWRPRALTATAGVFVSAAVSLMVLAGPAVFGSVFSSPAEAQAAGQCSAASYDRSYNVAAINAHIPYNRWGNVDPHGEIFVLQQDQSAVKNWSKPLEANPADDPAGNRRLRPRPLVLRANAGECVKVEFTNELNEIGEDGLPNDPRASMKVFGPSYDVQTSDGSAVGFNDDTTVPNEDNPNTPGQDNRITYFWKAPTQEGSYLFRDQGALSGSEADSGSTSHGLYGAFVVEPAGSTWRDPVSGKELYTETGNLSGDLYVNADINPPTGKSFRETVQISQDEIPTGIGMGFNYGAEPGHNRIATNPAGGTSELAGELAPDAVGEETSLSSWTYGDPALIKLASGEQPWLPNDQRTNEEDCNKDNYAGFNADSCYVSNVVHSYVGDPTKIRFTHAGVKETHVFHMHAHQWKAEPNDPESTTIDSQTFGPGESFTADLLFGAGSKPGTFGDSIFHCHLYPHFADGFWSLFRVHDVLEDGTGKTPDGINVAALKPLTDQAAPPAPTANNPGYPRFIPGKFGWRAPQPPGTVFETDPNATDNPNTVAREDLKPATRIVAGKEPDPAAVAIEQAVQERYYGGTAPKPGAPFTNPCPPGSREVTYNVSAIQTDVVYNEAGWHDTQGRIVVLDKDVDDILAGRKKPEPLFIRVNAGDCINYNLTNRLPNWIGNDAFIKLAQTNMIGGHIHLVKFDVLASDGASNGWNYQQAAFSNEQMNFNKDVLAGNKSCNWNGCRLPLPADYDPNTTSQGLAPGQTITERWYADYELRTVFAHDHHFPALDQNRGYFNALIVEPKGMDFRNPRTGDYYQPINDPAHGTLCDNGDNECEGLAAGAAMDVIGPGGADDFREFGLAIQDFVSLTKAGGNPRLRSDTINAPDAPEEFPDDDPGTMGINYRNAPFQLRDTKNGQKVDPAYVFSSSVFGDPETPVLQTYTGDPVQMRVIQGSQEEQHVLSVHGMRWQLEPDDLQSPLVNTQAIGISEAFNFKVPKISCSSTDNTCAGDYLYSATGTDDVYQGMWGILRARGKQVPSLLPLPDNVPAGQITSDPLAGGDPTTSGIVPPSANSPGTPCPTGAPVKRYDVVAMQADIKYNEDGDHDPYGLLYAEAKAGETPDQTVARVKAQDKHEPLVLRANEGDCVEVNLINKIPTSFLNHNGIQDGDPEVPTEPAAGTPAGRRVSLHPQLVKYDVRGSDGATVGYNRDQTVAPGDSRLYRWYADDVSPGELGATNLLEFGDVRGHRHHGLFAGLNIEPKGATYHDPQTGDEIKSGGAADIRVPGPGNDFREFTTFFQDGLNLRDATGAIIEDPLDHPPTPEEPLGEALDAEDQGEKGFNYANAPFEHRIGHVPETGLDGQKMSDVFNSRVHGDPDTPIFRAYSGDKVKMRVLQGSDKPRQHSFQLSGHSWMRQPNDPGTDLIGTQGGISVGRSFDIDLPSVGRGPGDYRYGCAVGFHHLPGGLWGIMRVYPQPAPAAAMNPTPIGAIDDPRAGGHPIMPLEISAVATSLTLEATPDTLGLGGTTSLSGRLLTAAGDPVANRQVVIEEKPSGATDFTPLANGSLTTDANGGFRLDGVAPQKTTIYQARFAGDPRVNYEPSLSPQKQVNVDAVAPSVSASPIGGTYSAAQSVTLTASEPADIFYTTDGSDPLDPNNIGRTLYSAPINIGATTTLKYAAIDRAGNKSSVATETYTINITIAAPGAPTNVSATAGNASATVDWTPPTNDGGRAITEYRVQVFNSGGTLVKNVAGISANATSAVVSGLNNGSAYKFKVQASNTPDGQTNVWGTASAFSNTVTPTAGTTVTAPGEPLIGTAVSGVTTDTAISATAKWTAPTNTGGSAITEYKVTAIRFSSTGAIMSQSAKTTGASATKLKFTGLVSGGLYRFEVRASNTPAGQTKVWGPASALSNQVTAR